MDRGKWPHQHGVLSAVSYWQFFPSPRVELGRYNEILQRIEPLLPNYRLIAEVPLSAREISVMYLAVGMAQWQLGRQQEAYQRLCVAAKTDPENKTVTTWKASLETIIHSQPGAVQPRCPI